MKNPLDAAADAEVSKDKAWHSMLRTTCVATMLDAAQRLESSGQTHSRRRSFHVSGQLSGPFHLDRGSNDRGEVK